MHDYIITLLLTAMAMSLGCIGVYNTIRPGRIFGRIGQWAEERFSQWEKAHAKYMQLEENQRRTENIDLDLAKDLDHEVREAYVKQSDMGFLVFLLRPTVLCPPCFASVWGSIFFLLIQMAASGGAPVVFSFALGLQWVLAVLICCAFNAIIHQIQLTLHD